MSTSAKIGYVIENICGSARGSDLRKCRGSDFGGVVKPLFLLAEVLAEVMRKFAGVRLGTTYHTGGRLTAVSPGMSEYRSVPETIIVGGLEWQDR